MSATIVSASDAVYFDLLKGLVLSIRAKPDGADIAWSILDVGSIAPRVPGWPDKAQHVVPDWDFNVPSAMNAIAFPRPACCLRHVISGHDVYP